MEYIYRSTDAPSSKWYAINMRQALCPICEHYGTCQKADDMPIISPLSRHIFKWHSWLKTSPLLPFAGTWEDQPFWYVELLSICEAAINKIQDEIKKDKEHGNRAV